MSTSSELKALFARLGPVRDADPPPSFSGDLVPLALRLAVRVNRRFAHGVSLTKRLRAAGLTLQSAYAVVNRLKDTGLAVCRIAEGANIPALAADLEAMNMHVLRRRQLDPGLIAQVRARHGLSQREFAELLGIDVDTLQNWEQGRNKPDAAALNLVMAYDKSPELIEQAAFEPVT